MDPSNATGLLGRIALHYKLVTHEQLSHAVREQGHGNPQRIGEILLRLGYITREQLEWLLRAQEQVLLKQREQLAQRQAAPQPGAAPAPPAAAKPVPAPAPPREAEPARARSTPSSHRPASAPAGTVMLSSGVLGQERGLAGVLARAIEVGASDVHVHAGAPLQMRIHGTLQAVSPAPLDPTETERAIFSILTPDLKERFATTNDIDFAYSLPGVARFRTNVYREKRGIDAVFRSIPLQPPTLDELELPRALTRLVSFHQGLVLLTGPAGCGKSSTLAALVRVINEERRDHIITVEDPIEYLHASERCVMSQRQVTRHTESFASALRAALREDPDVIVIGEMRDLETVSLAITAAETGHLVLATLHTNSAVRTINRILDVFPPKQQAQVRAMVSESLRAIVSQRLVPTKDGARRVPALEILMVNPAISNLIRDEKTFQIRSILQTGRAQGMCLLDDSLQELVKSGTITKETARRYAEDTKPFV